MGVKSLIEWTGSTWNPLTGCSKVSPGCKNCYAERLSKRLKAMGQPNYRNDFQLTLHEDALDLPLRWKKPQNIFVNSMSDLFHNEVPLEFIQSVLEYYAKSFMAPISNTYQAGRTFIRIECLLHLVSKYMDGCKR